ncbi:MAG: NAD(P)-dependent oxidoreductase [Silicimonas sp.]|nr:NAD(P)-dependent oxidoreductase [Silicimonas sp.]
MTAEMNFLTDPFLIEPSLFNGPVLVTGAGGCIGAWTTAILHRSGVDVIAFDLLDDRRRPGLLLGDDADALTWEAGDVASSGVVRTIAERHNVQAVIHLAGLTIPFCIADPALGARVNVEGTINILETARALKLKRLAYASSAAVHGMPPGGPNLSTLYGAYKLANEQTAKVYALDWGVPSVGIRPNVVYGVARDSGMSARFSIGIAEAVLGNAHDIPYTGPLSFLYAGEAASAFIAAVSRDGEDAHAFDLNGPTEDVGKALEMLREFIPEHRITSSGEPMAIPPDLDDAPIRSHLGPYPAVSTRDGIEATFRAFTSLKTAGQLAAYSP